MAATFSNNPTHLIKNIFASHYLDFKESLRTQNKSIPPKFIDKEIEEFLRCGNLAAGFIQNSCRQCGHTNLVAFSCKRRGFCPSCAGKRMNQNSHFLSQKIFPRAPVRQWVLSFPFFLRYLMAYDPQVVTHVLNIYAKAIEGYYKKKVPKNFKRKQLGCGAITVIQRFGSALNLNVHFHSLFIDGTYLISKDQENLFFKATAPTSLELEQLVNKIRNRTLRWLTKNGYLLEEYIDKHKQENPLAEIQGASVRYRIAVGPRKGQIVEKIANPTEQNKQQQKVGRHSFAYKGFSMHAGVYIGPSKRNKLEKLIRYISRGPLAKSRIIQLPNKQISYQLKSKWSDGTTHALFTPLEFIEKIVALIPPPRANLVRYHGLFAPNAKHRNQIIRLARKANSKREKKKSKNLKWAEMLKKTFDINIMECTECGGSLQKIGIVRNYAQIQSVLSNLGIRVELLRFKPAVIRGPPKSDQVTDHEFNQAPPGW